MNWLYKFVKNVSDKLIKIDKKAITTSFSVTMIFVVIWILYGYHINEFSHEYRMSMINLTMSQTENESEQISSRFNERFSTVKYAAASFSNVDETAFKRMTSIALNNALSSGVFDELVFIDSAGKVYFANGEVSSSIDTRDIISKCDLMKTHTVFANTDNFLGETESFGVIAPVKRGAEIRGYVCGISSYMGIVAHSDIRDELIHDEVILDEKGRVVVKIEGDEAENIHAAVYNHDFFEIVQSSMSADEFSNFITQYNECVKAGVPGKSLIASGNDTYMYIYYPISDANGWTIVNCYPDSAIENRMKQLQVRSIVLFIIIVGFMVAAGVLLVRYINGEHQKLSDLEYLDGLTGALNRNAFVRHTQEVIAENPGLPYRILCFDVINFRIINETYGHERSDVIIKAMADACREAFGHNESYGRLTADVFVAAVIDDGEEEERISFIENYVSKAAREVYINRPIKIKRGVYSIFGDEETIDRMIDKANIARKYVDFKSSKLMCVYSDEIMNDARMTEKIESQMDGALANGEFVPFLQAKYDMRNNHVCGAEALVRWVKPDGTIVPPKDFVPIFEKNGFIEKIDFHILESVCKYIRTMIDEGREVYKVSINQSRYLMNDPEYVSNVKQVLLKYQIPVGLVELELTETVFFHEKERMIKTMNDLKKMNVDLAIDDFGTGYSSFNILKDVPFDVLKIDRSFLTDAVHTEKGRLILKQIVEMAHGLGMSVICEGVETKEQAELLMSFDCHYAQGFLYARPIPVDEFIDQYNMAKE